MKRDTRGQAFTLEGVAAAVLLLASLVFALQVAAVTPNSGSTANPAVGTQQAWVASDLLAAAGDDETLRATVLHWDETQETFHGAQDFGYYVAGRDTDGDPRTAFIGQLEDNVYDRGFAYNLDVVYLTPGGSERIPVLNRGTPSDDAVRAVQYVTLYDDDELRNSDESLSGTQLYDSVTGQRAAFYAPDVDADGPLYNVLRVEVTVWRV